MKRALLVSCVSLLCLAGLVAPAAADSGTTADSNTTAGTTRQLAPTSSGCVPML